MADQLMIWTIYREPADYPGVPFVVRGWIVADGQSIDSGALALADTLDEARRFLPTGLVCLGRDETDEPHIVESWI